MNIMGSLRYITILLISLLVLSSCVSKKKYLDMVAAKEKYQEESKKMNAENKLLKTDLKQSEKDFKLMKDFLFSSDAAKNDELVAVQKDLLSVEESYNVIKEDLNKTKDMFKDQRYFNAKASSEIARLEIEIKQLARDTASLNYSMKLARQRVDEYKNRAEERTAQLNDKNIEIGTFKTTIATKDSELAALKSTVEVEKAKINQISELFIALRKQMILSNSKGVAIDPNSNSNIDKIGKALGHY